MPRSIPANIPDLRAEKLDYSCEQCARTGHVKAAVERFEGENLCEYHRDGDPCPECEDRKKEIQPPRMSFIGQPIIPLTRTPPPPAIPVGTVEVRTHAAIAKRIVPKTKRVGLRSDNRADVPVRDYTGTAVGDFAKAGKFEVRYPSEDEFMQRFPKRVPHADLLELVELIRNSPTGYTEFPIPKDVKDESFRQALGKAVKARGLRDTMCHLDKKRNTVIVRRTS